MFCIHCGREIDDDLNFCPFCGMSQKADAVSPPISMLPGNVGSEKDARHHRMKRPILAFIVVGIVIVIGVGVAVAMIVAQRSKGSTIVASEAETIRSDKSELGESVEPVDLAHAEVGDTIEFGRYVQTAGDEPVEWNVLAVKEGHALLLSAWCLDCRPISSSISPSFDITWEKSEIREWLNDDFLSSFSDNEAAKIDTTVVEQSNSADGATKDKVFLLSAAEVGEYLPNARGYATSYAQEQGACTYSPTGIVYWWLRDYNPRRDSTSDDNYFLNVFADGEINESGYIATKDDLAIRPAMWVSLVGKGGSWDPHEGKGSQNTDEGAKVDTPVVRASLSDYSWDELAEIARQIEECDRSSDALTLAQNYNLVDASGAYSSASKNVRTTDGKALNFRLIGIRHDETDTTSSGRAGLTFMATGITYRHRMAGAATTDGGWASSEMRSWLNKDVFDALPSDLAGKIVAVDKRSNNLGKADDISCVTTTTDRLWIPSIVELAGSVSWGYDSDPARSGFFNSVFNAEGSQYEAFSSLTIDTENPNSTLSLGSEWWMRSTAASSGRGRFVSSDGNPSTFGDSNVDRGVVFAFCL